MLKISVTDRERKQIIANLFCSPYTEIRDLGIRIRTYDPADDGPEVEILRKKESNP